MKVYIDADGVMTIRAISELEAYALRKWGEENANLPESILLNWHVSGTGFNEGDDE